MNNINAPIPYQWELDWAGSNGRLKVNLLLKAVIDKDVSEMERLAAQGASLKESDPTTLQRILFHVANCYPVMEWLVKHGLSRIGRDVDADGNNGINSKQCISPAGYKYVVSNEQCIAPIGYQWGLIARAYHLGAYDVMDLLAAHGFDDFTGYEQATGELWAADEDILRKGDPRGLKVLLENGYVFKDSAPYRKYYRMYVLSKPQVERKTIGLDPCKFHKRLPALRYEVEPWIFGRKKVRARNVRRREDYADRVRAHREFAQAHGAKNADV